MNKTYNINEDLDRTFVETNEFKNDWHKLNLNDDDLKYFLNQTSLT